MREGRTTVHFQKRAPGHSREFLADLLETDVLASIFQDIMKFVDEHVSSGQIVVCYLTGILNRLENCYQISTKSSQCSWITYL